MGEVVELINVRRKRGWNNLDAIARDVALELWSCGYKSVPIEAVVWVQEICRAEGHGEEVVVEVERKFARFLHQHLMALYPTHLRR